MKGNQRIVIPKNPKIYNVFERLEKNKVALIDSNVARELSKLKPMRFLREKDMLIIGKDHKKDMSVVYIKTPLKKVGKGFRF